METSNLNPRPMTASRPRPPNRTKAAGTTLNLPTDAIDATPVIRRKLSSSSMSSSIPPDSPPTTFDSPSVIFPRTTTDHDDSVDFDASPTASKGKWKSSLGRAGGSSVNGLSVPFPTGSASPLRQRQARARAISTNRKWHEEDSFEEGTSSVANDDEGPEISPEWLSAKSKEELEALLLSADKVIREERQKLALIAQHGFSLLEEHENLRQRHESLLTRNPVTKPYRPSITRTSEVRDRPPPSPASWRQPFNTGGPRNKDQHPSPTIDDGWEDERSPQPLSSSPSTPLRSVPLRSRVTSAASISSLFAPSPRVTSSPTPQEIQLLNQANYELTLQLSELEADSERTEREGKKKLRKLEKDLHDLRQELARAENRNDVLEDQNAEPTAGVPPPSTPWVPLDREHSLPSSSQETPTSRPPIPPRKGSLPETPIANFAPPAAESPATPTNVSNGPRRSPGVGTPLNPARQFARSPSPSPSLSTLDSRSVEERHDELVAQLMSKIDELQEANETISEERVEMAERLEQAQNKVDELKRHCEDLEEFAETALAWEDRKGAIGWRSEGSEESPVRLRGNQSMMDRNQLSQSTSDRSISSIDSFGQRHNFVGLSESQRRTLGSELGSEWQEDEEDDYDERSEATASTSTPIKYERRPRTSTCQSTDDIDEIVPQGSLREGAPNAENYEQILRAVGTLPPVWEDEYDFTKPPPTPSRTVLGQLEWTTGEASEFWDDKDPESEQGKIESKEDFERRIRLEAKQARAIARKLRRRHRPAPDIDNDDGEPISPGAEMELGPMLYGSEDKYRDEDEEGYSDSDMSDFDVVQRGNYNRRGSDYYPLTLRARYHPRMIVTRARDAAVQHAQVFATYIRFFFLLAFAVAYALWQGPTKTLTGRRSSARRRLQQ